MGFWEIKLGGEWKSLGKEIGKAANDAKAKGAPQIAYKAHGQEYILDFGKMEQINRASGRGRPVRCKGADGGIVIEKPPPSAPAAPAAPSAPAAPAAPAASGGVGFKTGVAAGVVGAGAAGVGIALAVGAIDVGDITDAAIAAGDAIGDVAGDAAEAIADAAADVADLM